jgi:serine phosphatase RsbU (regulator of sigma subunit)
MTADCSPDADFGVVAQRFFESAHLIVPDRLAELIRSTAADLGALHTKVWLADHSQRVLVELEPTKEVTPVPIDGSVAGRCFVTSELVVKPTDDGTRAWFPLLDGVDRIGVLEVALDALTEDLAGRLRGLASMATAEIVTRGQYTDLFTATRRLDQLTLSAELQWQQLPPNSFSTEELAVSGMIEPAYDVGGDSYDYAYEQGHLQFAILDSVGHDLRASLISTLSVTAYRHARRRGMDLLEQAASIDAAVSDQFDRMFTTGQLGDLDSSTGVLRWLNAGHPLPLLIRHGQISTLACAPRLPFGLAHMGRREVEIGHQQLEPGDAVLLYTDGVIESKRPGREDFGVGQLGDFLHTADAARLSPAETLRRLSNAVVDFNDGSLQDDATTFLVVWRPQA